MKYLILSICVLGCLAVPGFAEEEIPGCYTFHSYREEFRFETHSRKDTLEKFKNMKFFNLKLWKEMEEYSLFKQVLCCLYESCPEERGNMPPDFVVTPLVWALTLNDMRICKPHDSLRVRYPDVPLVLETMVCHVKNEKNNHSYFLCVQKNPGLDSSYMVLQWWYDVQTGLEFKPYKLQDLQDFQTQLIQYLESLDFGPNEWDTTRRCVSLRLYGWDSEKQPFQYPLITKEEKEKRYEELSAELIDE